MIFTQSMADLGLPDWTPLGVYTNSVELHDSHGYGLGVPAHVEALVGEFHKAKGDDAVLVRARFKVLPGGSHPSYRTIRVRVTGDLYERQGDSESPRKRKRISTRKYLEGGSGDA